MIWNLEKLEQERLDLIEVIDNLKRWERFSIDDRHIISLQITAHMMRLSQLDEDLAHLRSQEFARLNIWLLTEARRCGELRTRLCEHCAHAHTAKPSRLMPGVFGILVAGARNTRFLRLPFIVDAILRVGCS